MQDARRHATLGQPCFSRYSGGGRVFVPRSEAARVPPDGDPTDVPVMAGRALRRDVSLRDVRAAQIAQLESRARASLLTRGWVLEGVWKKTSLVNSKSRASC